jgi:hypothetical protein
MIYNAALIDHECEKVLDGPDDRRLLEELGRLVDVDDDWRNRLSAREGSGPDTWLDWPSTDGDVDIVLDVASRSNEESPATNALSREEEAPSSRLYVDDTMEVLTVDDVDHPWA